MKYPNFVINAWNTISQRRGKENTSYSCPIFLFSLLKFWLVAKIRFLFLKRCKRNDAKMKAVITSESPVINVPQG